MRGVGGGGWGGGGYGLWEHLLAISVYFPR